MSALKPLGMETGGRKRPKTGDGGVGGGVCEKFLSSSRAQEKYTRIVLNEIECLENVQLNKVRFESATYSARLIRRPNGLLSDLKINRQVLRDGKIL